MTAAEVAELERSLRMFSQKCDRMRKSADKAFKDLRELQHDLINIIASLDDLQEAKEKV